MVKSGNAAGKKMDVVDADNIAEGIYVPTKKMIGRAFWDVSI